MYRMVGTYKDQLGSQNLTYFHVSYYEWGHLEETANIQIVFCVWLVDLLVLTLSCMDKIGVLLAAGF